MVDEKMLREDEAKHERRFNEVYASCFGSLCYRVIAPLEAELLFKPLRPSVGLLVGCMVGQGVRYNLIIRVNLGQSDPYESWQIFIGDDI